MNKADFEHICIQLIGDVSILDIIELDLDEEDSMDCQSVFYATKAKLLEVMEKTKQELAAELNVR